MSTWRYFIHAFIDTASRNVGSGFFKTPQSVCYVPSIKCSIKWRATKLKADRFEQQNSSKKLLTEIFFAFSLAQHN